MAKTILVADDDNGHLLMMESVLTGKGYAVQIARNGEQAVEKARQIHPDLIIMDVEMPKLEGDAAAMILKESPDTRAIPILFCTGLQTEQEIEQAHDDSMVAKPVHFDLLLAKIKGILGE